MHTYFYKGFPALSLRDDLEVVLVACNQNGRALEYASNALKDDREVVRVACKQDGNALFMHRSE